jgi:hypothetical protein
VDSPEAMDVDETGDITIRSSSVKENAVAVDGSVDPHAQTTSKSENAVAINSSGDPREQTTSKSETPPPWNPTLVTSDNIIMLNTALADTRIASAPETSTTPPVPRFVTPSPTRTSPPQDPFAMTQLQDSFVTAPLQDSFVMVPPQDFFVTAPPQGFFVPALLQDSFVPAPPQDSSVPALLQDSFVPAPPQDSFVPAPRQDDMAMDVDSFQPLLAQPKPIIRNIFTPGPEFNYTPQPSSDLLINLSSPEGTGSSLSSISTITQTSFASDEYPYTNPMANYLNHEFNGSESMLLMYGLI